MILEEIIKFIDDKIPQELALKNDKIGFTQKYDLNQNIESIKIMMDLLPKDDEKLNKETLVITHHPPIYTTKTTTYTIHSNWDIIRGGSNDALAKALKLKIIGCFDRKSNIGRICSSNLTFKEIIANIYKAFPDNKIRIVNKVSEDKKFNKIATISGFGLKNIKYIDLAKEKDVDLIISGDLTHEVAILAKKSGISVIDLNHHISEIPGLYKLEKLISNIGIPIEVIDNGNPWEYI